MYAAALLRVTEYAMSKAREQLPSICQCVDLSDRADRCQGFSSEQI